MTKPALFLDFDGVINFSASAAAYQAETSALGYLKTTTLVCGDGAFNVRWSGELVRELNAMKRRTGFEWLWLSTWREWAVAEIDPALGTRSDGCLPWNTEVGKATTYGEIAEVRSTRKYLALLAELLSHPRPFAWVDDDATGRWRDEDFVGDLDVPRLILAPRTAFGILRPDLDALTEFMERNKG